jgi:hypothetical protein
MSSGIPINKVSRVLRMKVCTFFVAHVISSTGCRPAVFMLTSNNKWLTDARTQVSGEDDAMKADVFVKQAVEQMKAAAVPGFVAFNRTVCKSEWAYELEMVFSVQDMFWRMIQKRV